MVAAIGIKGDLRLWTMVLAWVGKDVPHVQISQTHCWECLPLLSGFRVPFLLGVCINKINKILSRNHLLKCLVASRSFEAKSCLFALAICLGVFLTFFSLAWKTTASSVCILAVLSPFCRKVNYCCCSISLFSYVYSMITIFCSSSIFSSTRLVITAIF